MVASPGTGVALDKLIEAVERVEEESDVTLFAATLPRPAHLPPRPADPSTEGYYGSIEIENAWKAGRMLVAVRHLNDNVNQRECRVEDHLVGSLYWRDLEEKHIKELDVSTQTKSASAAGAEMKAKTCSTRAHPDEKGLDQVDAASSRGEKGDVSSIVYGCKEGLAYICNICVSPQCGRQGTGTRLLHKCLEQVRENGYRELWLTTFANVPFNAPWYARQGFVLVEMEKVPAILLERFNLEIRAYGLEGMGERVIMKYAIV